MRCRKLKQNDIRGDYTPRLAWASARAQLVLCLVKAQPNSPFLLFFLKKRADLYIFFRRVQKIGTLFSYRRNSRLSLSGSLCLCFSFLSLSQLAAPLPLSALSLYFLLSSPLSTLLHQVCSCMLFFYLFYFIAASACYLLMGESRS